MLQGIADNAGTILVAVILAVIVAAAAAAVIRDKKRGKSSCGSSCGCCPMAGSCHKRRMPGQEKGS